MLACAALVLTPMTALAAPWLMLTDIHFDPTAHGKKFATYGSDTNGALLVSTIAEMRRVDRDAPVVVITGDFLGHNINWSHGGSVMAGLARRFDRAFPNAQFVLALGNEDSACADYSLGANAPFLRKTATAWAPLVNRHGAAPNFLKTFAHDGFYTATLPIPHVRAVVVDNVFWSPRYHVACGATRVTAAQTITEIRGAFARTQGDRHWLLVHIPPGIDAYSTAHLSHGTVVVPFLNPAPRDAMLALTRDPANHIALVVAAHTHKFAFRIAGTAEHPVPMLLVPSVSPIFRNAPSFLTADVDATGTIRRADDHAYLDGHWQTIGSTATLGLASFSGPELVRLQARLLAEKPLRATFDRLYNSGASPEISESNWRIYWCAATAFNPTAFRGCLPVGGYSIFTRRGLELIAFVTLAFLAGAAFVVRAIVRSRRRRLA